MCPAAFGRLGRASPFRSEAARQQVVVRTSARAPPSGRSSYRRPTAPRVMQESHAAINANLYAKLPTTDEDSASWRWSPHALCGVPRPRPRISQGVIACSGESRKYSFALRHRQDLICRPRRKVRRGVRAARPTKEQPGDRGDLGAGTSIFHHAARLDVRGASCAPRVTTP